MLCSYLILLAFLLFNMRTYIGEIGKWKCERAEAAAEEKVRLTLFFFFFWLFRFHQFIIMYISYSSIQSFFFCSSLGIAKCVAFMFYQYIIAVSLDTKHYMEAETVEVAQITWLHFVFSLVHYYYIQIVQYSRISLQWLLLIICRSDHLIEILFGQISIYVFSYHRLGCTNKK